MLWHILTLALAIAGVVGCGSGPQIDPSDDAIDPTPADRSTGLGPGDPPDPTTAGDDPDGEPDDAPTGPDFPTAEDVDLARLEAWNRAYPTDNPLTPADRWEVYFDGSDTAADAGDRDIPHHLRWDVPIDDRMDDPDNLLLPNHLDVGVPERGYYHIDRTYPADNHHTGNFFRRDEALTDATGFTVEARVQLFDASDPEAFVIMIDYLDRFGQRAIASAFLSPGRVTLGHTQASPEPEDSAYLDTSGFVIYRLVKKPSHDTYDVYVNGNLMLTGEVSKFPDQTTLPYVYPMILIGDPSNDIDVNSKYTLDYAGYSRAAFTPAQEVGPRGRDMPPLPEPAPAAETFAYRLDVQTVQIDDPFFYGSGTHHDDYEVTDHGTFAMTGWQALRFSNQYENEYAVALKRAQFEADPTLTPEQVDAAMAATKRPATKMPFPGIEQRGAATIEARLRIGEGNEDGGYKIGFKDELGEVALLFSRDRIELARYKVGGVGLSRPFEMDTTDAMHTYRIVRAADAMYTYVYVDDHPVPVIWDFHLGGGHSVFRVPLDPEGATSIVDYFTHIWIGYIPIVEIGVDIDADVEYVQWHGHAWAPAG